MSREYGSALPTTGGANLDLGNRGMPGINTCDPSQPDSPCGANAPAPPGCGDGMLTSDEACDDGNRLSGDGCTANCLAVERGYSCNPRRPSDSRRFASK